MNTISLSWNDGYRGVVAALAGFIVGYFLYWFVSNSVPLKRYSEKRYRGERAQAMHVLFQRGVGIVFLGFPAAALTIALPEFGFKGFGVTAIDSPSTVYWIAGISAAAIPLVLVASRKRSFFETYPLIRENSWGAFLLVANTVSWGLYILTYEYLFRGFLLGACLAPFGVWPAILVNVAVYGCVHIPYGFFVTLGSLPLGVLLCIATVQTGNIWTACAVHLLVALLNDYVALASNPRMRVDLRRAVPRSRHGR